MKTIKKTTLIAAITAMAAFAVPAMASASVWGPLNTNQSLDSTNSSYASSSLGLGWTCTGQHLATHVRTPASSTLDITAASWSGCVASLSGAGCGVTMTPTGLPWTATGLTSTAASTPWHAQVTYTGSCGSQSGLTFNIDGTLNGVWTASTHTVTLNASSGSLTVSFSGSPVGTATMTGSWRNPTQTLTLT